MVELLSPVRDETSFTAAAAAGADAVYFGLGQLNMRINSKGIDLGQLPTIVKSAHTKNIKAYVTLNAIIYDDDTDILDDLLNKIKQAGADAVICSDFAVIEKARQMQIQIHISTQANISNTAAAKFFESLGARRAVLARELTLEQIKEIKQNINLEIETFVHGAMCVSVSGRCYMSQFLDNASANRGDCYQPCRRSYKVTDPQTDNELEISNGYILSPKDLCALPILDKLIEAGIDAFKIEGRSRPADYIATVTAAYRRAIDSVAAGTFGEELVNELLAEVKKVYNRGFSTGFYLGRPGPTDFANRGGSLASQKRIQIGKVLNFFKDKQIAHADIQAEPLAVGDTVQIHGPTTGVVEFQITQIRTEDKHPIDKIEKGRITFPSPHTLRRNDKIFKLLPA